MAATVSVATIAPPCADAAAPAANPPTPRSSSTPPPQTDTKKFVDAVDDNTTSTEPFLFRSKFPDIPSIPNHLPLHTYCFQNISLFADRPCLINGTTGDAFTFAETHRLCRKAAAGLRSLGVCSGDAIMVLLHNTHEYVFSFMGASILGAMTTAANPFCTPNEIHKQFKASGAKVIITHSSYADKLVVSGDHQPSLFPPIGQGEDRLTVVLIDDDKDGRAPKGCLRFSESILGHDLDELPEDALMIDPDSPVALPFSSGTTGLPKGVMLTHRSLITSIAQQVDGDNPNLHLTPEDVVLCVLPLFHIFSLNSVLLCSLRTGSAVLLMKKFDIGSLLDLVQTHRVTVAPVVPPLVLALAKNPLVDQYDLSSIRIVLSGAAPLGKDLEQALHNRLPQAIFGQGYGMTEAGPVLSMCSAFAKNPLPAKSGSCGTVVRNAQLKVIDPETGVSLRHNQPGEICIRGQQIMKGYLNDPEATSRTIDVQGWLHTGDIGYVDDDDEVYIVDRVKELIKFKGFQVPPAELESLLLAHSEIADAAVVPQKDDAAGEVPVAFVVTATHALDLTEDAVKEFISKQVVFYKRLHKVYFVQTIPKSAAGKILRKDLKAKLATSTPSQ